MEEEVTQSTEGEYESLAQYLERTNALFAPLIQAMRHQAACARTRHVVEVIARKPRARRGRRRK